MRKLAATATAMLALALGAGTAQARHVSLDTERSTITRAAVVKAGAWWHETAPACMTITYSPMAGVEWGTAELVPECAVYVNTRFYTPATFGWMYHPSDYNIGSIDWQVYCASIIAEVGGLLGTPPTLDGGYYEQANVFCGNRPD